MIGRPDLGHQKDNCEHKAQPDPVWSSDITYVPMPRGFMNLTAVIELHSRYVLAWRLSNMLEGTVCVEALEDSLLLETPRIFNIDPVVQSTAASFVQPLEQARYERRSAWRPRPSLGPCVRGAPVAKREVRVLIPVRLRHGGCPGARAERVLRPLLSRTSTPGLAEFHAGRGVRAADQTPTNQVPTENFWLAPDPPENTAEQHEMGMRDTDGADPPTVQSLKGWKPVVVSSEWK
ncbi:MAG TPA: DDE-type integrase/transposase/recombinase [Pirellulales bacterium]|jgi:hypothetical protein|nr:DDE-type integrase/transposase/recombinase [Pirellulales bacterium]